MGSYEYWAFDLRAEFNVDCIMDRLGSLFEIVLGQLKIDETWAIERFVSSGLAEGFERQNDSFIRGMSGLELADYLLADTDKADALRDFEQDGTNLFSVERWMGEMAAYFQVNYGYSYRRIFELCSPKWLRRTYYALQGEDTPEQVAEEMLERFAERPMESALRGYRQNAGMTQTELAEAAGLSMRAIQQYEQGTKDINHASAASLYKLACVLGCRIEDLLQHPVR